MSQSKDNVPMLRVGDTVRWSPLGSRKQRDVVVRGIQIDCVGQKTGTSVSEVPWREVHQPGNCVVDLANGRWAYGYQIEPIDPLEKAGEEIKAKVARRLKETGAQ